MGIFLIMGSAGFISSTLGPPETMLFLGLIPLWKSL